MKRLLIWALVALNTCVWSSSIAMFGGYGNHEDPETVRLVYNVREQSPVLDAALNHREYVRRANKDDIDFLLEGVAGRFDLAATKAKITEERTLYKNYNDNAQVGSWALKSSVGKLWKSLEEGNEQLPICTSAIHQLTINSDLIPAGSLALPPVGNQVTAVKYGLFIAWLNAKGYRNMGEAIAKEEGLLDKLTLVYPAVIPEGALTAEIQESALYDDRVDPDGNRRAWFFNADYIFGGDPIGADGLPISPSTRSFCRDSVGRTRGLDCSSLTSLCAKSSSRLSTVDVYYGHLSHLRQTTEQVTSEKITAWKGSPQGSLVQEFDFLPNAGELQPGDIVNWRKPAGGGHTAVFATWVNKEKEIFAGVDDNRFDPYIDGVSIRKFTVTRTDAPTHTTMIRRR